MMLLSNPVWSLIAAAAVFAGAVAVLAAVEPAPGRGGLWQVHSGAEHYVASQTPAHIIVRAIGKNPTGGFTMELAHTPEPGNPLVFTLRCIPPKGVASQAITRFEVTCSIEHREFAKTAVFIDAAGRHEVVVDQARD